MPQSLAPFPTPVVPPPRPVVLVALAHIMGMTLGLVCDGPAWPWIAGAAGLALTGLWLQRRARWIRGPQPPSGALLLAAVLALGGLMGQRILAADRAALAALPAWAEGETVWIAGRIAEEPNIGHDRVEILLDRPMLTGARLGTGRAALTGRVALRFYDEAARALVQSIEGGEALPGQPMRVRGTFHRTDLAPDTPTPFNAWRYWRSRGIYGRVTVYRSGLIEKLEAPQTVATRGWAALRQVRAWLAANLALRLHGESLSLARALLLGEAGLIEKTTREGFTGAGWAHVLAVSGLHTGFILILLFGAARLLWLSPRGAAWFAIAGLVAFAALTGFRPPVLRAVAMSTILLFGFATRRFTTPLAFLATAAWLTLLLNPRNLLRMDWQLSYGCALAIILLAPPLYGWLSIKPRAVAGPEDLRRPPGRWRPRVNRWIILSIAVTSAIQLGLAPLQLFYFQTLNPIGLVSNWIGAYITLLAVLFGFPLALLGGVPWLGAVLAWPTQGLMALLAGASRWFAALPLATVHSPGMPPVWMAVFYAVLLTGCALRGGEGENQTLAPRQRRSLIVRVALCVIMIAALPLARRTGGGMLDFYMLDVGQGDSLVVRFPNRRVMVIDGGRNAPSDQGVWTVGPFLRTLGVQRIDYLVATHADADHIGGLPSLIRDFEIGAVIEGDDDSESALYAELEALIRQRRLTRLRAQPGLHLSGTGRVDVELLGPLPGRRDNDGSVVMLLDDGAVEILATGDLEAAGERHLLESGRLPDIEVLKVGHHGSASSTTDALLAATRPDVALISVGAGNPYGHPVPAVLGRLAAAGAWPLRTDQLGTLWVRSDGRRIEVFAYLGEPSVPAASPR